MSACCNTVFTCKCQISADAAWHTEISLLIILFKKIPENKKLTDLVLSLIQETSFKYIFPTVFQLTSDKQKLTVSYK